MYYLWNILTPDGSFEFLSLLAVTTAKATLMLAFVALIVAALRHISAATRHLLWTFALCAALLLPLLSSLTVWEVPILPAQLAENDRVSNELSESGEMLKTSESSMMLPQSPVSDAVIEVRREKLEPQAKTPFPENLAPLAETSGRQTSLQADASPFSQPINWILAIWIAGALLLLLRLFMGLAASCFLVRRCGEFKNAQLKESFEALCEELGLKNKVRLLRDERALMPVACGIFRPAVLLPAEAEKWSAERQQMVLLHELAHVARRDCLTQMLAQTACAFYWFNPLIWFAARRLRIEREQACDDRVLSIGTKPSAYAHHLLEIARSMQDERSIFEFSQTTSVAMAQQSQLEGRLLAILSRKERLDKVSSRAAAAILIALMCFLSVSISVVRPTTINARKSPTPETVFVNEEDKTLTILPETLLVSGANQSNNAAEQNAENYETIKKQNNPSASFTLPEPKINDRRIDKNDEQNLTTVKENADQNISEAVQRQNASPVQTPQAVSSPAPEVNPFVNARYQQESKPQAQNKSGDFIDEMASVGLSNLSIEELIKLKTHRVTADYIRGLRAHGFDNLTPKTITNLRIYNVTAAYIEALAAAGYKGLTLKELTSARIYNVTPEYAKAIREAGYPSLSIGQLINFRIYSITPEFVRAARNRSGDLTPKQMISLKISGALNKVEDRKKGIE